MGRERFIRVQDPQPDFSHAENTKSFAIHFSGKKKLGTGIPTLTQLNSITQPLTTQYKLHSLATRGQLMRSDWLL